MSQSFQQSRKEAAFGLKDHI